MTKYSLIFLRYFLSGVLHIGRGIAWMASAIVGRPIKKFSYWLLHSILSRLYLAAYFPIKRRVLERFPMIKGKSWYPFSNRYVIHALMLIIAVGVFWHSIQSREVSAVEFGSDSLIAQLLGQSDVEIVETAETSAVTPVSYLDRRGLVGHTDATIGGTDDLLEETSVAQGGSTIVKPNIPTTELGNRPREAVEHYIVQGGDTIGQIAERFNVSTNTILWENRLGDTDFIKPGDQLTILPQTGLSHQVKDNDTVSSLAKKYKVDSEEIIEYNKLASADAIKPNDVLIIPGGELPELAPPKPAAAPQVEQFFGGGTAIPPPARVAASDKMLWPTTSRRINQYYTWRHSGVDIDGEYSSPVYAADGGTVTNVGWGSGYGLHVLIDHGGGKKTIYAHLSKTFVSAGQAVGQGATLGMQGCTGWCTGVHLHFEVIINGSKVNPLSYL
ncbi:MAG: peptidoglycan DD-metalloendopeptidase family protein [bacterium]|nr:peptidoglycan DD-metalloendopeptidase family protein [bacterium]